ncbi:gluconate 5-dehydrogenase [Yersinia pseudotuberculosis]
MDVFTASLRSACSLRRGHFVLNPPSSHRWWLGLHIQWQWNICADP